jgi:3-oxo-5-alpha-steroid 4-dehydrogenase 3
MWGIVWSVIFAMKWYYTRSESVTYSNGRYVIFGLWFIHLLRRLLETIFVTDYGEAKMHVGGLAAGIIHYCVVPCTIYYAHIPDIARNSILYLLSICIYVLASIAQFEAHLILYRMKGKVKGSQHYSLPTESTFRYLCTPHYTAEIIIYLSLFALSCGSREMGLMSLWVIANLAVVSNRQYHWYLKQFGGGSTKDKGKIPAQWCRLVPYVW